MASIDTSELEYLKSCRDKLRDVGEILEKDEGDDEEKLKEIKRIMGGNFPRINLVRSKAPTASADL